jgi:hypothetical protein
MSPILLFYYKYRYIISGALILAGAVGSRFVQDPWRSACVGFSAGIAVVIADEMFGKARKAGRDTK